MATAVAEKKATRTRSTKKVEVPGLAGVEVDVEVPMVEIVDPIQELQEKLEKARGQKRLSLHRIQRGLYQTWDGEYEVERNYYNAEEMGTGRAAVVWWLYRVEGTDRHEVGDPRFDTLKQAKSAILGDRIDRMEEQLKDLGAVAR